MNSANGGLGIQAGTGDQTEEKWKQDMLVLLHAIYTQNASKSDTHAINAEVNRDVLNNQIEQRRLYFHYRSLLEQNQALPNFADTGFRVYSQSDEDGLLLYIFSLIGFSNRLCLDMAFCSPYGANTTNLLTNWGFNGLLVEGQPIQESIKFFESHRDTWVFPPKVIQAWVTADNVNQLCRDNGLEGVIDLFSLDIDSVDYRVWKRLEAVQPRVVVAEFNTCWGTRKAVTIPEIAEPRKQHTSYYGASLAAFVKLARDKGYRLVGVNRYGFNAFFVKRGLAESALPEVSFLDCLDHPRVKHYMQQHLHEIEGLEWIDV